MASLSVPFPAKSFRYGKRKRQKNVQVLVGLYFTNTVSRRETDSVTVRSPQFNSPRANHQTRHAVARPIAQRLLLPAAMLLLHRADRGAAILGEVVPVRLHALAEPGAQRAHAMAEGLHVGRAGLAHAGALRRPGGEHQPDDERGGEDGLGSGLGSHGLA